MKCSYCLKTIKRREDYNRCVIERIKFSRNRKTISRQIEYAHTYDCDNPKQVKARELGFKSSASTV